jgi:class 3 adenylate cyclase
MSDLPTGTITFLFTDIEGSTRLLQELGESYEVLQDMHGDILRRAVAGAGGTVVRTEGDHSLPLFQHPARR